MRTTGSADAPAPEERRIPESRRDEILAAAIRCFAARGFEATSTREIAREANVKQPLVFYHFSSKADLYLAAVLDQLGKLSGGLQRALDGVTDDLQRVRVFTQTYWDHFTVYEPGLSVCLRELRVLPGDLEQRIADEHSRAATSVLRGILAAGIEAQTFRALDPEACAFSITGILQGFLRLRPSTQERLGPQAAVDQVLNVYCAGLVNSGAVGDRFGC